MTIPDEIRLSIELLGVVATGGTILLKLGRMGERFDAHSERLDKVTMAIDKIEDALQTVAVQKDQIQSIRETQLQNAKRTDETFTRVFNILDALRKPA